MRHLPNLCAALVLTCLSIGPTGCGGAGARAADDAPAPDTARRSFELTYRAVVEDVPEDAGTLRLWLPYPSDDEHQEVEVVEVSAPVGHRVTEEPEFGNRILYLEMDDPGRRSLEVILRVRVRRDEVLRKDFHGAAADGDYASRQELAKWLEPDALVPLDEQIRGLSAEVTAGAESDLEKARAIYDYVVANMTYKKEGSGWGKGDIYWACNAKSGNCTDFHALFTGLARAAGIPAKFAIGFPIPAERGHGEVSGYHCWSEFYLDGYGWVPVDASEASKTPEKTDYYFGGHDENRVEFSEGRDVVLRPEQQGGPLNYFVYPHVEVDGRPHDAVRHAFSYRDLGDGEA